MPRFNLLYWLMPVLGFALFGIYRFLGRETASFYGVAENQETEINLDHAGTVTAIFVAPGQFVTAGTLLLELSRPALTAEIRELGHELDELQARDRLRVAQLQGDVQRLLAERREKSAAIQSKIQMLESEIALNRSLLRQLTSVALADTSAPASGPQAARLDALRQELQLALAPIDAEIARVERELALTAGPAAAQLGKLRSAVQFDEQEQQRLRVFAPAAGLIGAIHCKPGENVPAFSTLVSFYEQNPNTVVAYVHESLILKIQVGDTLRVASSLHPSEACLGQVAGLGHRVVEIPERLRKLPEIKTYGREVLVRIPANNRFLQKEKVALQRTGVDADNWFDWR